MTHLPVTVISLTCHYRAAFPADATMIALQTKEPCFHMCYWAPVLPFTWTKSCPSKWQLQEAYTACPKEAQGLLGNTTFSLTSIITPVFTHFITLDFLFYFWQFCYRLCFHFQGIIFSSIFPLHLFFLHSVSHFSFFPLRPTAFYDLETIHFPSSFLLFICRQLWFLTQQFL